MKKTITVLLCAALLLSAAACGAPAAPAAASSAPSASAAPSVPDVSEAEPSSSASEARELNAPSVGGDILPLPGEERAVVMDAARFLGTVEDFAVSDDGKTVLLMNRAVGSNYEQTLKVKLTDDTKFDFDSAKLGNGAFLEVYYGGAGANDDGSVDAIQINNLGAEEMVNYNGTVKEVYLDPEKADSGYLLLDPIGDNMEYQFNFGPSTQFYMDLASIKAGDQLNVLHSPISTRSIPPQSPAWEISAYTAPAEGELPVPAADAPVASVDAGAPEDAALVAEASSAPEKVIPNTAG